MSTPLQHWRRAASRRCTPHRLQMGSCYPSCSKQQFSTPCSAPAQLCLPCFPTSACKMCLRVDLHLYTCPTGWGAIAPCTVAVHASSTLCDMYCVKSKQRCCDIFIIRHLDPQNFFAHSTCSHVKRCCPTCVRTQLSRPPLNVNHLVTRACSHGGHTKHRSKRKERTTKGASHCV